MQWLGLGVGNRSPLIAEALRDRNALFQERADGSVENGYTLKIINKTVEPRRYRIAVEAGSGIALRDGERVVEAAPEEVLELPVVLSSSDGVRGKQSVVFTVTTLGADGASERVPSTFFGPLK